MKPSEIARRRDQIINLLSSYGELSATALSDMLQVTVQTIRADLRDLDDNRLIKRRHGSASLISAGENIGYQPRRGLSRAEKHRIGAAVAKIIPHGASVALGTGTTVEAVARALSAHEGLSVATNNIHAVLALRMAPGAEVSLAGGKIRLRDLDFIGAESADFFAPLRLDFAIFSVGGMTEDGELLDFNPDEIRARRAIFACARQRILVLDHNKIGRDARHVWGRVSDHDAVVCGAPLPIRVANDCAAQTCKIIVV